MKKKIIELEILEDFIDSGVSKISLVDDPAIQVDWFAFDEEKFVYPETGESKDDFIPRCIEVNKREGRPDDQSAAICYRVWKEHKLESFDYAPQLPPYTDQITKDKKTKLQDQELDIFGYKTKYFYICPGAVGTFKSLMELPMSEETIGMVRSAALIADKVFEIEANVLERESASVDEVSQVVILVDDFKDLMHEIDEEVGVLHDVSYMDGHVETVASYYTEEFITPNPCQSGYEAIGMKIKGGKKVPNCVPVKSSKEKFESYSDYPKAASLNACRAVAYAEEYGWGDCGTDVGKHRAHQLCNGDNVSEDTIARMAAFERHRQNKDVKYNEGCGGIMWDAWGGEEGIAWAQRKLKQIRKEKMSKQLFANEDEQIIVGPAMIPDIEIIRKGEDGRPYYVKFTKEVIAKIAEKFMRELRNADTNIQHEDIDAQSYVMETWLVEDPKHDKINTKYGFNLPEGTWAVKMRVKDKKVWELVKEGKLNGFSIEGNFMSKEDYEEYMKDKRTYENIAKILKSC